MAIKRKISSQTQLENASSEEVTADASVSLLDVLEEEQSKWNRDPVSFVSNGAVNEQVDTFEIAQKEIERMQVKEEIINLLNDERIQHQELCSRNVHLCMDIKVAAIPDAGLHVVDTCKNTHFTVSYCIFCKEIIAVTMDSPRKDSSYPEEYDKEEIPKSRWDFFDAILQRDMQIRDFKPDREKIMNALKSYIQVKEFSTRGKGLHFNQYDTLLTGNVEALLYGYMPMTNQRMKRLKELESELAALKVKSKFLI